MPDYAAYLERARAQPGELPRLTEREFYDQYLRNRYAGGGFRCC